MHGCRRRAKATRIYSEETCSWSTETLDEYGDPHSNHAVKMESVTDPKVTEELQKLFGQGMSKEQINVHFRERA